MVATEAAKDHSLQGWRGQQHKENLTLHLLLTPAGLPFRTKFYKNVVGEDFLPMTPIAHKPQGSEQHQNQSFYLHRWIETIISRSKVQISSLVLKLVVDGGSILWKDWLTYLILVTHREYILKIRFKIGCSNYSFSNIGDRNSINLSMFGQQTWPGIPNQLEISQANNQPSSCSHSNIHIFPPVVIRLQFWE